MTPFGSTPDPAAPPPHPAADDLGFDLPPPAQATKRRVMLVALLGLGVLAGAFLFTWLPKRHQQQELVAATHEQVGELMRVEVVQPKVQTSDRALVLPGSVQALAETVLYPRANGFVRSWNKDIGDKVKEGDVLADIELPEIDQQISQARAQLAQAQASVVQSQANASYAATELRRYQELAPSGATSQQELDKSKSQKEVDDANVLVAQANVDSLQANVRRLQQTKEFGRITAPFAGTITSRTVEKGALVSSTTPLFKLVSTDPVRVLVQVPQDVATGVRVDVPAKVTVREYSGRVFDGKVARAAGALDPMSRTMTTEVRVPNPKNELFVGMYAQVELTLPSPHHVLEIPATSLLVDAKGMRVAVVTPERQIHLVPVAVERDTGSTILVTSGVVEGDQVVKNASASLTEGRPVDIATK